jgi:hypothetical protein
MVLGALALGVYSVVVCQLMMRFRWSALQATALACLAWLSVALAAQRVLLGAS